MGAILNSANFHESFFATHPSYHNVEGPKIGGTGGGTHYVMHVVCIYIMAGGSLFYVIVPVADKQWRSGHWIAVVSTWSVYNNHNLERKKPYTYTRLL